MDVGLDDIELTTGKHRWNLSGDDSADQITARCANGESVCEVQEAQSILSLIAEDTAYTGQPAEATVSNEDGAWSEQNELPAYFLEYFQGETKLDGAPADIGDYTVRLTAGTGDSAISVSKIFSITEKGSNSGSGGGGGSMVSAGYQISLPDSISSGSASASAKQAKAGEKVTITVTPEEGYQISTVNVTDKNGSKVDVTDNGDGTYSFTMPKSDVSITPVFTEIQKPDDPDDPGKSGDQACPKDDTCPMTPFTDADKQAWYHDGVHWALEEGVMNGTGENTFEPLTATTRAMIVTMLWRMEGSPQADASVTFKDVQDGQWYTDAIRWAVSNDIVNGYDEETFGTNDSVTREQLATILYRSAQTKGKGFTGTWAFPLNFDDADQVSEWADEAMHWMIMNGVIQGMNEKELSPQGDAVRAQVATMLMRFSQQLQV